MEKIKTYGSLFLTLLSAFNLGFYASSVKYDIKPVDPHQWVLTVLFGAFFLVTFVERIKKN